MDDNWVYKHINSQGEIGGVSPIIKVLIQMWHKLLLMFGNPPPFLH